MWQIDALLRLYICRPHCSCTECAVQDPFLDIKAQGADGPESGDSIVAQKVPKNCAFTFFAIFSRCVV
jgi:hypothetical protein